MSVDLSGFDPLARVPAPCFANVRLWHKADIDLDAEHVHFRADIPDPLSNVR